MVLQGQYLERPTLIARPRAEGGALTLEGLYHRGEAAPAVVVCAPHPRLGGSMDSPVVAEIAWALTRAGHATLRFNFQGVGASEGSVRAPDPGGARLALADLREEIDDARAAVRHLAESVPHGRVALAGYSFGAAVALGLALDEPAVERLALVAPPSGLFDLAPLAEFPRPVFVGSGQHDPLVDRAALRALLPEQAKWELVAGADHAFTRGLTELGRELARWFG